MKTLCENDFKIFGGNILLEGNFSEVDIAKHFNKKPFLRDILMSWSKLNFNSVIYKHYNEIFWNNSNIRIDEKTVFYKNWFQSGIKYVKDIFDHEQQAYYTFRKLQDNYNLPNTDYLRYLNPVNIIPKDWKSKLRRENSNIPTETKIEST